MASGVTMNRARTGHLNLTKHRTTFGVASIIDVSTPRALHAHILCCHPHRHPRCETRELITD